MNDAKYYVDNQKNDAFVIENYQKGKPFSSFLPGIAGLKGIPIWCFYVNRGQCIASFGVKNKDGAILEFNAANKAYNFTAINGFRTFIKIDDKKVVYQPFFDQLNELCGFKTQNKMVIYPHMLEIEELNTNDNLKVNIKYITLPENNVGGLIRIVEIKNLDDIEKNLKIIDGLNKIVSYGMNNFVLKNMSRTIEAWAHVDFIRKNALFYRIRASAEDTTKVVEINEGNFYISLLEKQGQLNEAYAIADPNVIFGENTECIHPINLIKNDVTKIEQVITNKTSCAYSYCDVKIKPKDKITLYSIFGFAYNVNKFTNLIESINSVEFFDNALIRNREIIYEITDKLFVNSGKQSFNSYTRVSLLDNYLRGGVPIDLKHNDKEDIMYVFSRKHGDLERDYNDFEIEPSYYSQGNGAYRDINQNRRSDLFINPKVKDFNIRYFINLIQLDGYNPLGIRGVRYKFNKEKEEYLKSNFKCYDSLKETINTPFSMSDLMKVLQEENNDNIDELVAFLVTNSEKIFDAVPGEGYWVDHWTYNLDLLERFEEIYPEKIKDLLSENSFYYYDNEHIIRPRSQRYVYEDGNIMQYKSYVSDKNKKQLIDSRNEYQRYVRTNYGYGEVYKTNIIDKMLCLIVNKIATLDPFGKGIEMEADKPGWNDALNGLPGVFGSSVCETMELKRLIDLLLYWIEKYKVDSFEVTKELYEFMDKIHKLLKENLNSYSLESNFRYWDRSNTIKEEYREKTKFGVNGKKVKVDYQIINEFLSLCKEKLNNSINDAYDNKNNIYNTYYINKPKDYEIDEGKIRVKSFEQYTVPAFLEGQVHALRVEDKKENLINLYNAVKNSDLYDNILKMYKTNASLENATNEIGRLKAFTPGWLENESIFLHMEYKYILELLKRGLYDEYYNEINNVLIPFLDPQKYGRSIFENSSFIASSANPNKNIWGQGFVARLSGSTAEFINMLTTMAFGERIFYIDESKRLNLQFKPILKGSLFTTEKQEKEIYFNDNKRKILLDENTFAIMLFGRLLVIYKNPNRIDTFAENAYIKSIKIDTQDIKTIIDGSVIGYPYSTMLRDSNQTGVIEINIDKK
ncbi:hypothetical protein ACAG39_04250 [Caldicellulosiruptoraceae bacterium PP1]